MSELPPRDDEQILRRALLDEKSRYPIGFSRAEKAALYVLADDLALQPLVRRALLFAARHGSDEERSMIQIRMEQRSPQTP